MFVSYGFIEIEEVCHLMVGVTQDGSTFFHLFSLYTLFCRVKKIVQCCCGYVGLSGLVLQSNISNCLGLILHRQLGKLRPHITLHASLKKNCNFYLPHYFHICANNKYTLQIHHIYQLVHVLISYNYVYIPHVNSV